MLLRIVCLSVLFLSFFPAQAQNQKRALIIAVGKHEPRFGWPRLATSADLKMMRQTFERIGFPPGSILTISDEQATKANIIKKVEELIRLTHKNDKVIIHFSGHGQQVQDLNGDEIDRYDEALVAYDTPQRVSDINGYKGEKHILDDEIGIWVDQLRQKTGKGGHVVLILDACHSGTGAKGNSAVRGSAPAMIFEKTFVHKNVKEPSLIDPRKGKGGDLGKFVLFAAADSSQTNHETVTPDGKPIGTLSYMFSEAMSKVSTRSTYADLFDRISSLMANLSIGQTPQLEGDNSADPILGGDFIEQSLWLAVKRETGNAVKVLSGWLNEVYEDAKMGFYAKGDDLSGPPRARGVVTGASHFESTVRITEGSLPEGEVVGIETERSYGKFKTRISLGQLKDPALKKKLTDLLVGKSSFEISEQHPELKITEDKENIRIDLVATGEVYQRFSKGENQLTGSLLTSLLNYSRARLIRSLDIKHPDFKADISFRPATFRKEAGRNVPVFRENAPEGTVVFEVSESGLFTIKNTGRKAFYFTLADIQPDGGVNIIFPDEGNNWGARETKLEPGQQKEFTIVGISEPLGMEMFKVFLLPEYVDLSFLSTGLTQQARGNHLPLVTLLKDFTDGSTFRSKGELPLDELGTATLTFRIVSKR